MKQNEISTQKKDFRHDKVMDPTYYDLSRLVFNKNV